MALLASFWRRLNVRLGFGVESSGLGDKEVAMMHCEVGRLVLTVSVEASRVNCRNTDIWPLQFQKKSRKTIECLLEF